jgi:hypothetical protein
LLDDAENDLKGDESKKMQKANREQWAGIINPLPNLTLWNAWDLKPLCRAKCSRTLFQHMLLRAA